MSESITEENMQPAAGNVHAEKCIYQVPGQLRRVNAGAYTPQAVSIGPIHRDTGGLMVTEQEKDNYLEGLTLFGTEDIAGHETRLRNCYAYNTEQFGTDDFVRDARFIIAVLLRYSFPALRRGNDIMVTEPRLPLLRRDMALLENQLPFFILEVLFDRERIPNLTPLERQGLSVMKLSYNFFKPLMHIGNTAEGATDSLEHIICGVEAHHFVDLLRNFYVRDYVEARARGKMRTVTSVRELQQGDVKFEVLDSSNNLFDIDFPNDSKILKIPKLIISHETELTIRNVLAFEQCHHALADNYMTDYVVFMDRFMSTEEDVRLLVQKDIVEIRLTAAATGTLEGAAKNLIERLAEGCTVDPNSFYFAEHCQNVDKYCRSPKMLQKTFTVIGLLLSVTANILQGVYCAKKNC